MIVRKFTKYTPLKNYKPSNEMYDQCYKSTIYQPSQNQNSYVPHFLFFIAKKNLLCHNNNITSYLLRNDFLGSFWFSLQIFFVFIFGQSKSTIIKWLPHVNSGLPKLHFFFFPSTSSSSFLSILFFVLIRFVPKFFYLEKSSFYASVCQIFSKWLGLHQIMFKSIRTMSFTYTHHKEIFQLFVYKMWLQ